MKRLVFILLAQILALVLCVPAAGAAGDDARQPDYDRTGSVAVDIATAQGEAVSGGTLTAYLVADAVYDNGDNLFVFTPDFSACGLDLGAVGSEENGSPVLAASLADYALENGIAGITAAVGENGRAVFSDLSLGLYVVTQQEPAEHYEPIRPFAVTVPYWDGEKLIYDVYANPKPESSVALARLDLPVEKVVVEKSGIAPEDAEFVFRMEPGEVWYPVPETDAAYDPATGTLTVKAKGPGSYSFGELYFGRNDAGLTYTYEIYEVKGDAEGFTYDEQVYRLTVAVSCDETAGEILLDVEYTDRDGKKADAVRFTNVYEETPEPPPDEPELPDTGQLWWPVPLLLAAGLGFIAFGWIQNRRNRKT